MGYQIGGDNGWNRIQVKFSHYGQTGVLGVRSKGQILLNFNQKDFYTKCCVCSHKKDTKHIDQTIRSVACVMHKWCDLVMLEVKNLYNKT